MKKLLSEIRALIGASGSDVVEGELLRSSDAKKLPPLYSQEKERDPMVIVKFFNPRGAGTWLATEYDPDTGTFFGYVMGLGGDELGYFALSDLKRIRAERDSGWKPMRLSAAKAYQRKIQGMGEGTGAGWGMDGTAHERDIARRMQKKGYTHIILVPNRDALYAKSVKMAAELMRTDLSGYKNLRALEIAKFLNEMKEGDDDSVSGTIAALRDTDYRDKDSFFKMVQLLKGLASNSDDDEIAKRFLSAVSDALTDAAEEVLGGGKSESVVSESAKSKVVDALKKVRGGYHIKLTDTKGTSVTVSAASGYEPGHILVDYPKRGQGTLIVPDDERGTVWLDSKGYDLSQVEVTGR